ncbi:MAG: GTP 3',8-cyclase MoaA [Candidatus Thorarchaeota archaeon]
MSSSKSEFLHAKSHSSKGPSYVDDFGRRIDTLRISLTQRCSYSCFFCHHEGENDIGNEMSLDEIEQIVKHASAHGIRKVKLTGGEPLMRTDILDIVKRISPLVTDLSMTTNGLLLEDMALSLKHAGLSRVNVSIHSLDPEVYFKITGSRDLERVKRGVKTAVEVGLTPVKVNMTVIAGYNDDTIWEMMDFASDMGVTLQIIEMQQIPDSDLQNIDDLWVDLGPLEEELKNRSIRIEKRSSQNRFLYTIPIDSKRNVSVEIVRPMHNTEFCEGCTRLRVTSDGKLKPCLYRQDNVVEVFPCDGQLEQEKAIQQAFKQSVSNREPYWRDEN